MLLDGLKVYNLNVILPGNYADLVKSGPKLGLLPSLGSFAF